MKILEEEQRNLRDGLDIQTADQTVRTDSILKSHTNFQDGRTGCLHMKTESQDRKTDFLDIRTDGLDNQVETI